MRVIAGTKKGKHLVSLPGGDTVRPTTDRVKEALFSAIHFDLPNASVVDMFAGSGQLGIESLSRGAEKALFIDSSQNAIKVIKQNIDSCGFQEFSTVLCTDYALYFKNCKTLFDIAFIDPPYPLNLFDSAINTVSPFIKNGGVIVCEHPIDASVLDLPQFSRRDYKYGNIAVTLFRKEAD